MTQYLLPIFLILMVLSPVLFPAIVTVVHLTRSRIRAAALGRRTALESPIA